MLCLCLNLLFYNLLMEELVATWMGDCYNYMLGFALRFVLGHLDICHFSGVKFSAGFTSPLDETN